MKPTKTKCLRFSRTTGYHAPLKNWNAGKKEEFRLRKTYDVRIQKPE